MNNLLGRQVDANYTVRMYCIRGLGNMADIKGTEVREGERGRGKREREGGRETERKERETERE